MSSVIFLHAFTCCSIFRQLVETPHTPLSPIFQCQDTAQHVKVFWPRATQHLDFFQQKVSLAHMVSG